VLLGSPSERPSGEAVALSNAYEEVTDYQNRIADRELNIRAITTSAPFATRGPRNPFYSYDAKQFWKQSRGEIEALHEQISQLKQERLDRISQMMGRSVGGEMRLPTDFDTASVGHRPAIMLDKLEEQMDHIIDERKRIMELRMNAQHVVDAFQARAEG
jgi:DNA repair exonuclease SbcCD ATPase subunit